MYEGLGMLALTLPPLFPLEFVILNSGRVLWGSRRKGPIDWRVSGQEPEISKCLGILTLLVILLLVWFSGQYLIAPDPMRN